MESFKYYIITLFLALQILHHPNLTLIQAAPSSSGIIREYIGAMFKDVRLSDVPINPDVEFHFILSFGIDYNTSPSPSPSPTNGKFNVFWDTNNLTPSRVASIKKHHRNVKVALSIGGATVEGKDVVFRPKTTASWVSHAVSSLTSIIEEYHLDGIDIDYEQFTSDPTTFAECIGQLVSTLKRNKVIKFASIAPFDDSEVQRHYIALWRKYGHLIDYVNFQFYAYDKGTSVSQFIDHFHAQSSNYNGGRILASFASDGSGGLSAAGGGFIDACRRLKRQNKLHGIFGWSADDSKASWLQMNSVFLFTLCVIVGFCVNSAYSPIATSILVIFASVQLLKEIITLYCVTCF